MPYNEEQTLSFHYYWIGNIACFLYKSRGIHNIINSYSCIIFTLYTECVDADYFQCDNKYCIPQTNTCNGYNDCFDNSDEETPCFNGNNISIYCSNQ